MPCKFGTEHGETCSVKHNSRRTSYACIIEAHESTRSRSGRTQSRDHEDHIAEKKSNSLSHYDLVHKPIPIPMKIPDANAAVDKKWDKLEKLPTKVKSKKEVIEKAQRRGKNSSFSDADGLVSPQELGVGTTVPKR